MNDKNKYLAIIPVAALIILALVLVWPMVFPASPTADPSNPSSPSSASQPPEDKGEVVATINDVPVYMVDFAPYRGFQSFFYAGLPPEDVTEATYSQYFLDMYLSDLLLANYIKEQNITVDEASVEAQLNEFLAYMPQITGSSEAWEEVKTSYGFSNDTLRDVIRSEELVGAYSNSLLASFSADPAEIDQHYQDNAAMYTSEGDLIAASHILVPTEAEAQSALGRLQGGENFADLAKELSTDIGSAVEGGFLGVFDQSVNFVEPFKEAVFALTEVGQITDAVYSEHGYHIIKLDGQFAAGTVMPLDFIRSEVAYDIVYNKANAEFQRAIESLYTDNTITTIYDDLDADQQGD